MIFSTYAETKNWSTMAEAVEEFNVSKRTILRAVKTAGIQLPKGRRKASGEKVTGRKQ